MPFHNEVLHLSRLIDSLRGQSIETIAVVCVDNQSTDGSATVVQRCEEVKAGNRMYMEQPRVGKFFAMKAGTAFCADRLGAKYVGFLDADSYCADSLWAHRATSST